MHPFVEMQQARHDKNTSTRRNKQTGKNNNQPHFPTSCLVTTNRQILPSMMYTRISSNSSSTNHKHIHRITEAPLSDIRQACPVTRRIHLGSPLTTT